MYHSTQVSYQFIQQIRILIVASLILLVSVPGISQGKSEQSTISVHLQVPEGILSEGDVPAIRGVFPKGQAPKGIPLTYQKAGYWIGEISAPRTKKAFTYEYVIVRTNGTIEKEWYDGREYQLSETSGEINDYLRGFGPSLNAAKTVTIRLDLSDLSTPYYEIQRVGVMGSYGGLTWDFPEGISELRESDEGVWELDLELSAGTALDIPLKFVWMVDDVWEWELLPHYQIHLLLLDPEQDTYVADFIFNDEQHKVIPNEPKGMQIDVYSKLAEMYNGSRNYHFHLAMSLLDAEDPAGAQQAFEQYKKYFPEEAQTTAEHFITKKIQYLGTHGMQEYALQEVEEDYQSEIDSLQKSYFRYLKGWVLLHNGRFAESRQAMQEAMYLANDEGEEHSKKQYARFGLAMGHLMDPNPGQREKAYRLFEKFATSHTNPSLQRTGWRQLANASAGTRQDSLQGKALHKLTEIGSPRQRNKAAINWTSYLIDHGELDLAEASIAQLEQEFPLPEFHSGTQTTEAQNDIIGRDSSESVTGRMDTGLSRGNRSIIAKANSSQEELLTDRVQLLKATILLKKGKQEEATVVLEDLKVRRGNKTENGHKAQQILHNIHGRKAGGQ